MAENIGDSGKHGTNEKFNWIENETAAGWIESNGRQRCRKWNDNQSKNSIEKREFGQIRFAKH